MNSFKVLRCRSYPAIRVCVAVCVLAASVLGNQALAAPLAMPLELNARIVRHPERAALLALAGAGARSVAVGERGIAMVSDDGGRTWRQAKVPVSVTLTAVFFIDERRGWAVGHAGVVLRTTDAGETWSKQVDGRQLAAAALAAADKSEGANAALMEASRKAARQLVADGADKPLLDVSFTSATKGIVVGAYGLAFTTSDGGETWTPLMSLLDNPKGLHLNAVRTSGDTTVIVGEQGAIFRSSDGMKTFDRLPLDYRGSLFALALMPEGELAVGGIKGNVFLSSRSNSAAWRRIELPIPAGVVALAAGRDGSLLIGSQAGVVFRKRAEDDTVEPLPVERLPMLTSMLPAPDGSLILAALQGVRRVQLKSRSTP